MVQTGIVSYSVDTPEVLRDVELAMQNDELMRTYAHLRR